LEAAKFTGIGIFDTRSTGRSATRLMSLIPLIAVHGNRSRGLEPARA